MRRLRMLYERGASTYGRWDTVNAYLRVRGLVAETERSVGAGRREVVITDEGRTLLVEAGRPGA